MSQGFDIPPDPLSKLTPTPAEITDETELEVLEAHFRKVSTSSSSYSSEDEGDSETWRKDHSPYDEPTLKGLSTFESDSYNLSPEMKSTEPKSAPASHLSFTPHASTVRSPQPPSSFPEQIIDYAAQQLHANLDARLQPFWSSAIANRVVRLSVFCPRDGNTPSKAQGFMTGQDADQEPLASQDVVTSPQGAFQTTFSIPWERLATHPPALHVAFGDHNVEYPVIVQAEMWTSTPAFPPPSSSSSVLYSPYRRNDISRSQPRVPSTSSLASTSSPQLDSLDSRPSSVKSHVTIFLSIPRVPIRGASPMPFRPLCLICPFVLPCSNQRYR